MKRTSLALAATFLLALFLPHAFAPRASTQSEVDRGLAEEIFKIKAIDNHAHPMRATSEGEEDREFDALIPDTLEPSPLPVRLRPDNPEYVAAWRDLWNYRHEDMTEAHAREVAEARRRVMKEQGDKYPAWVLDKLNIEVMFANRVAMGRGLTPERFRWVAFDDALMLPLSTATVRKENPDYAAFYPGEEKLLRRYFEDTAKGTVDMPGLKWPEDLPPKLSQYLSIVDHILDIQRIEDAFAVKFEAAYLRPLDFADVPEAEAARIYEKYARGGAPTYAEYKPLQDFLFRHIAREAGRRGMAVHIHTGNGVGGYFGVVGSNPALMESVFNDPTLRKTNFVIIHGGWPFTEQTAAMLLKPNVYADFSAQTFARSPHSLAQTLRGWLELAPEKVMFATDAFVMTPEVGWEEVGWLSNRTGRQALAIALTGMMRDGEITRARASELARMVMHDNAATLYAIK